MFNDLQQHSAVVLAVLGGFGSIFPGIAYLENEGLGTTGKIVLSLCGLCLLPGFLMLWITLIVGG